MLKEIICKEIIQHLLPYWRLDSASQFITPLFVSKFFKHAFFEDISGSLILIVTKSYIIASIFYKPLCLNVLSILSIRR